MRAPRPLALFAIAASLIGCGNVEGEIKNYDRLENLVSKSPVGYDEDQWIEMRNASGVWERTGLIFGYVDDFAECRNAIAGLKKENFARDYRCVPANRKK